MTNDNITFPESASLQEGAAVKIYTPKMIILATALGGSLAGCALVMANYKALGDQSNANKMILWGLVGVLGYAILHYFFSYSMPLASYHGIVAGGLYGLCRPFKDKPKASWGLAFLIGLAGLVGELILLFILNVMISVGFPHK